MSCSALYNNLKRVIKSDFDYYSFIKNNKKLSSIKSKKCKYCNKLFSRRKKKTSYINYCSDLCFSMRNHLFCKSCWSPFIRSLNSWKRHCSDKCLKKTLSLNGWYRAHSVKWKWQYVKNSFWEKVYLQSSYEVLCSELLNQLKISWLRPHYIKWIDSMWKPHKYYPDFYLPDLDIYLDPKNEYLQTLETEQEKISLVQSQNNIKVLILWEKELTLEYLSSLRKK